MQIIKNNLLVQVKTTCLDFLADQVSLSKTVIKKVIDLGGVWIISKNKKKRIRRVTYQLSPSQKISFYYQDSLLDLKIPDPILLQENKNWGVWFKPAQMLAQGTLFGDKYSILRHLEKKRKNPFLIHRLDREAQGIMLFAYNHQYASSLSKLFIDHKIEKIYYAKVLGNLEKKADLISFPIDNQSASTEYWVEHEEENSTTVKVKISSGRHHQIRKHFAMINHPLLGDPKYGRKNKNQDGLKLVAYSLKFIDPINQDCHQISLTQQLFNLKTF